MIHKLSYQSTKAGRSNAAPWFGWISLASAVATYVLVCAAYAGLDPRTRYVVLLFLLPVVGVVSAITGLCRGEKSGTWLAGLILNGLSLLGLGCLVVFFEAVVPDRGM